MPLIECPDCQREISPRAESCPQCACPIQTVLHRSQRPISGRNRPPKPSPRPGHGLMISAILAIVMGILSFSVGCITASNSYDPFLSQLGVLVIMASFGLFLTSWVLILVWLYRAWDAVPETYREFGPGEAVGLLFVPIFNFYWSFRVFPGLSRVVDWANEERSGNRGNKAGQLIAILMVSFSFVPVLNFVTPLFMMVWLVVANRAVNLMIRNFETSDTNSCLENAPSKNAPRENIAERSSLNRAEAIGSATTA